jgi:hypothetical protein
MVQYFQNLYTEHIDSPICLDEIVLNLLSARKTLSFYILSTRSGDMNLKLCIIVKIIDLFTYLSAYLFVSMTVSNWSYRHIASK